MPQRRAGAGCNGSLSSGSGFRRVACIEELIFNDDGSVEYPEETAAGPFGTASVLTALNGEVLVHEHYSNSGVDDPYPYTQVVLGSGLDRATSLDSQWLITAGKSDPEDVYTVSIESNNKPGLYVTVSGGAVALAQDFDGKGAQAQSFRTVTGLAGEGVSFESVAEPGKYLTLSGGSLTLTDGSDANAASFTITEV